LRTAGFVVLAVAMRPVGGRLSDRMDPVKLLMGVVGAAGGLGGFFPPLVMGAVSSATGSYLLGFVLLAATAAGAGVLTATVIRRRAA
jgi:nitrate/nitrite transporter NarK